MFDNNNDNFDDDEKINVGFSMEMTDRVMQLAHLLQANTCTRQEIFRHLALQYKIDSFAPEDRQQLGAACRMLERDLKFLEEAGYEI